MVDKSNAVCYNCHIAIEKRRNFMFASAMMMDMAKMYMCYMCMFCYA